MAEDILKQPLIAKHIAILYKEVRQLKRAAIIEERSKLLGSAEPPNNNDFAGEARFSFDAVIVTSLIDANCFLAQRTIPTSLNSPGWVLDSEFSSKPIIVTKTPQSTLPSSGDIVGAFFTGIYGDSPPVARYGWFDGTARTVRSILKTNRAGGNIIDCAFLDQAGVEGATVAVARPPELQKDYYSGETIDGVAYVHVDNETRTGDGDTEEIVPSYVADSSIILLSYLPNGTGLVDADDNNAVVVWQEITFRGWGVS